ncbi:hypothetical protein KAR10_02605, partial [bacterium]|nr:hypothetical protein [bacterium]
MRIKKLPALLSLICWLTYPAGLWAYENHQAADVVMGQPWMFSNGANYGGIGADTLYTPYAVCSDGTKIIISDFTNHRVLVFNQAPVSNRIPADIVIGQPNMQSYTANNGGRDADTLYHPMDSYSDGTRLYIVDYHNHRVLIYNRIPDQMPVDPIRADVVIGQPNMQSGVANNGGRDADTLYYPCGVYSDGTRLYIADFHNHRVLIYNQIPDQMPQEPIRADIVIGQPDMTSGAANNGGLDADTLYHPWGVYSDGTRLYIADRHNHRVLIYNQIPDQMPQEPIRADI